MSDPILTLRSPPIIEAVVDIECDFRPGQELTRLESYAKQLFSETYPTFRSQFLHEVQFEVAGDEPARPSARHGIQSLQFWKSDEKQLVQVRATGYSFNRLAPYSTFDEYLPEIRRTWNWYCRVAAPIQVKSIRLRYINRIHLPFAGDRVELDEYLHLGPRPLDEDRLRFIGFLTQYTAVDTDSGHQVTVVLTTQRQQTDTVPLIFDNSAQASTALDPEDWDGINDRLVTLRALKNRVFRNTLTPKCLNLFQ